MTEQEAFNKAESVLEEIQQYRAIGTVKELEELKESSFSGINLADIAAGEMRLKAYEKIGTVEECRKEVEKQRAKKPILDVIYHQIYYCPNCEEYLANRDGKKLPHCAFCGQQLDWNEDEISDSR